MRVSRFDKIIKKYPFFHQTNTFDCGIACIRMICRYYGKSFDFHYLSQIFETENVGMSMSNIVSGARRLGLDATGYLLTSVSQFEALKSNGPFILHWGGNHFVVVYAIDEKGYTIADPAKGIAKITAEKMYEKAFANSANSGEAYMLQINPTGEFYVLAEQKLTVTQRFKIIFDHTKGKSRYFWVLALGIIAGMIIQFILPFITRSVVDMGLENGDLKLIAYLLIGQIVLFLITMMFDLLQSWIVLHLSSRVNLSMLSSFLIKVSFLPISFFELRKQGDFLQRIHDNNRVEAFITRTMLNIIVSFFSIVIFSVVLYIFNRTFFLLFLATSVLYIVWMLLFIKARKKNDWERFDVNSQNQTYLLQVINGIQDLKVNNAFSFMFDKWEANQQKYIKTSFATFRLNQVQYSGASFIYQLGQLAITFYAARLILNNQLTLGSMLSIQFIIGQLVSPVQQLMSSVISGIETRLSMDRISELLDYKEEQNLYEGVELPAVTQEIVFDAVSFRYKGHAAEYVLDDISFTIEACKTTALVGMSGSGKTTALKLALGYNTEFEGGIYIGKKELRTLNLSQWRNTCGVVFQDNFIFNETIAKNIAMSNDYDLEKINRCLNICNLYEYVYSLPKNIQTAIGNEGKGLSQGQKQRIFIARAIYKDPAYYFLDEATNALDAENEHEILNNITQSFQNKKTIVFVAHRLSTVRHADKIIVFDHSKVVEQGTHQELLAQKGRYYELINKQI